MTVEELAEEVMAPRLHMASFALQLENLNDDPFVPWRSWRSMANAAKARCLDVNMVKYGCIDIG